MKQSNWILGLGILVAALLIAGTIYLRTKPINSNQTTLNQSKIVQPIKSINSPSIKSLQGIIERFTPALLNK